MQRKTIFDISQMIRKTDFHSLEQTATQIRRDILRMTHGAASGHPGGSLGCVEFFVALYGCSMNFSTRFDMNGVGEDLFFLSNGHISPVWYSTLARFGFFDIKELGTFRHINSRLQGHPTTHEGLPGVRIASGSLGQGLSAALGAAQTKKLNQDDSLVYVLSGDGELQEGQIWEAAMYAAHQKIDNLILTVDCNGRQIDGDVNQVLSLGDLEAKWRAFGWQVNVCKEGNHLESVVNMLKQAQSQTKSLKPIVNLMHTEMGQGVDFMMGSHKWHGVAPNDEQLQKALAQLALTLTDY